MKRIEVLDHGYVSLVESWGSEEGIIEAARMSTAKGFLGWGLSYECPEHGKNEKVCCEGGRRKEGDEKLLRFLYENHHATPFEMAGMTIEVQAPIFVFREWHRHRTQSYNEMSARYTPLPDMNYVPTVERLLINSKTNKQAGTIAGASELTEEQAEGFRRSIRGVYAVDEAIYQEALLAGVPKELARIHLPVGRYSRMRATGNLRGWLGFLTLRMAPNAQYEIRMFANAVGSLIEENFPRTWALFKEQSNG